MAEQFPPVSLELVSWLERLWPRRPARLDERHRHTWMEAGRQEVIDKLRSVNAYQTNPQDNED